MAAAMLGIRRASICHLLHPHLEPFLSVLEGQKNTNIGLDIICNRQTTADPHLGSGFVDYSVETWYLWNFYEQLNQSVAWYVCALLTFGTCLDRTHPQLCLLYWIHVLSLYFGTWLARKPGQGFIPNFVWGLHHPRMILRLLKKLFALSWTFMNSV